MKFALRPYHVLLVLFASLSFLLMATVAKAQAQAQSPRPWQQVTPASTAEVAANLKSPPREYGAMQQFQSWNGSNAMERLPNIPYDAAEVRARISRDLDAMEANGIFMINLSPGRRAPGEPAYLSQGHMDQVKYIVAELAKRNMRMWIQDESDYPSGFAGGYISVRIRCESALIAGLAGGGVVR